MQISNPSFKNEERRKKRSNPTNDFVIRFRLFPFKKENKLRKSYNRMNGPSGSQIFHWKYNSNKNGTLKPQLKTHNETNAESLNEFSCQSTSKNDVSLSIKHILSPYNITDGSMESLHLAPFEDEVKNTGHTPLPSLSQILEKYGIHLTIDKFKVKKLI